MVTNPYFAIGDLQGCLESLDGLLEQLPEDAPLIFLGDLVNRGPESLATLRRVAGLGSRARCLLGNHDLHLLAVAAGASKVHKKDTIGEIFEAPDADELIEWLRHQSIMIETEDAVFVHAGVHPLWTLEKARGLAREAEAVLSGPDWKAMLQQMYGNSDWDDGLKGGERMQAILNCFTRMRFVDKKTAELDFKQKEDTGSAPKHLIPWFEYSKRPMAGTPSASATGPCWASSAATTSWPSTRDACGAGSSPPCASPTGGSIRRTAPAGQTPSNTNKSVSDGLFGFGLRFGHGLQAAPAGLFAFSGGVGDAERPPT